MNSGRRQRRLRTGLTCTTAIAALMLSGCVGKLETRPYREQTPTLSGALRGVTYSLPKLQYEVKLTRALTECPGGVDAEGKPTSLKFGFEVAGTAQYVPGEAYTVNYHRLAGLMRTSNFEIKYWPNGNLKSLGAGADDKTADFVKDVVKTGASVASILGSGGGAAAGARNLLAADHRDNDVAILGCTEQAAELLDEQKDIGDRLKQSTKKLAQYSKEVERILARAAVRLKNDSDRDELVRIFGLIDTEEEAVAQDKERLGKISELLAVSQTVVWNSDMRGVAEQVTEYRLSDSHRKKLAGLLELVRVAPSAEESDAARRKLTPACFGDQASKEACVGEHLDIKTGIALVSHLQPCDIAGKRKPECVSTESATFRRDTAFRDSINRRYRDARDDKADSGIFVREPMRARLLFCRIARTPGDQRCTAAEDEGKMKEEYFPQLGQLRYLPLRVGTFQTRDMTIALAEDGRIESFTYKSTKAAAAGFAAMAADAASQVDAAIEKIETERRSDLAYAREQEVAGTQAEINRLTKEAELKKLQTPAPPPTPNPLQATLDETTVLLAEIGLLKAKLMKLQAAQALGQAQQP